MTDEYRPTRAEIEEFLAACADVLDEDERRADEELGAELREMGQHARSVTSVLLSRARTIRAMRMSKSAYGYTKPPFGAQSAELLTWLAEDIAAGVELMGGDAA